MPFEFASKSDARGFRAQMRKLGYEVARPIQIAAGWLVLVREG